MIAKSVDLAAIIVGYGHGHTARYRITDALNVFLWYSSPCGFHMLSKLIWCSVGEKRDAKRMHKSDVRVEEMIAASPDVTAFVFVFSQNIYSGEVP
ncbi:hypothetical protein TNCV_1594741 [Trichonephila clavipes]|nr:hypothetical protein TNCV_1594741 [Trichonephila clavipes]